VKPNSVSYCIRLMERTTGKSSKERLAVSWDPDAREEIKVLKGSDSV